MEKDFMIDSILCFVQSAKNQFDNEKIARMVVAFYSAEQIIRSKEKLFSILNARMIKRKTCERHPNPSDADVADIIELFDKHDGVDDVTIPTFVSVGMNAMPSTDMECMAGVLCSLRDEVAALRHELAATRAERDRDIMVLEKSNTIM